jgi:uncharacterized protein YukE
MYGDATAIRHLARQLRDRAGEIRDAATRLERHIDAVAWQGVAADAMRHQTGLQLQLLRQTAGLHDDAADALERHADEVQRLQDLIAAIERRVTALIDGARSRIAEVGRGVLSGLLGRGPDPVDELLAAFHPPPPGHLAWLSVDLPGL